MMGKPDATCFRCLFVETEPARVTWLEALVGEAASSEPALSVCCSSVPKLAEAWETMEAAKAEGTPVDLLVTSRRDLETGGKVALSEIHRLVDANPRLSMVVLGPAFESKATDGLGLDLPGRVLFVREPLCGAEMGQAMRLLIQSWMVDLGPVGHATPVVGEQAEVLLKALLQDLPNTMYFKDAESKFIAVSHMQAKWFGQDASDLVGKSDADIQDPDIAKRAREEELAIMRSGRAVHGLCEHITLASGSKRWIVTNKAPLRDLEGKVIGTFGVSTDISNLKQAEEELKEVHGRLLDVSRQAGMAEVATGVLHNVGNVLNSVTTAVSTLKDRFDRSHVGDLDNVVKVLKENEDNLCGFLSGERGEQFVNYLEAINRRLQEDRLAEHGELQELDEHVRHICQVVSMQQSYAKVLGVQEEVHLGELVDQAVVINSSGLERHGVELHVDLQVDSKVFIERHKVLRILVNLINNAKYACDQKSKGQRRIDIRTELRGDKVAVVVQDTGTGIAEEHMQKLFTHGFTTKKDGHGFGLHNSALVAQEMGGKLSATSEGIGKGACFVLELPVEQMKEAA